MSDDEIRRLERQARSNPDDESALIAFARAYLRVTEPLVIELTPETNLLTLSSDSDSIGLKGVRPGTISGALTYARSHVYQTTGKDWSLVTIRDFADNTSDPSELPGIGPSRERVLRAIVASAGLSFRA
jgi:hypothetical protein